MTQGSSFLVPGFETSSTMLSGLLAMRVNSTFASAMESNGLGPTS